MVLRLGLCALRDYQDPVEVIHTVPLRDDESGNMYSGS
jgi:hypothetical protein